MRKLFRNLIVRMGKQEQEESGSKEITPEDRVRALRERTEAFEQKPPAEELVPARRPPLTAPPVPAHSVEEPPTPRPEHGEYTSAESSTIPVFRIVREAYAFLWHQRRDFVSLVAPAFMVVVILSTLLTRMLPERFAAPGEFIVIAFPIIVAWVAMVVMFAVFYFLLIRPQQKKAKERQKMLDAIQKGAEIVTNGGIIGRVTGISDKTLTIEISEKVRVRVLRSQVSGLYGADNAEKK